MSPATVPTHHTSKQSRTESVTTSVTGANRREKFEAIKIALNPGGDGSFLNVKNFNENEDATCIEVAMLLQTSWFKRLVVFPLLSILTLFYFPISLYWNKRMQGTWLYSRAARLAEATHIYIVGRGESSLRAWLTCFCFRYERRNR